MLSMPATLSARGLSLLASLVRQTACPVALLGLGSRFPKARAAGYETIHAPRGSHMDEIIRRSQEQLAKCQEQIEKSREMIEVSIRWLTAYRDSVNQELQNLSISQGERTISSQARKPVI
jgi:hypothetical protein